MILIQTSDKDICCLECESSFEGSIGYLDLIYLEDFPSGQ